ncbi:MAG: ABC transporter permease subunit [Clostridia bacterium]|nr:ABC transporter permease subunit [Clostridia bacterium]
MKKPMIRFWAVAVWLLVWQTAAWLVGKPILLVGPVEVLTRLFSLAQEASFWQAVWGSLWRIAGGFFLAFALSVPLALGASRLRWLRELLSPLMLTIKTVPVASFIILALIWFSSRTLSILISFLMVLPILYSHLLDGLGQVDRNLREMAAVFRVPRLRYLRCVALPQLMPAFLTGCRIALGLGWKAGIAAEVIGTPAGTIGKWLQQAKLYLDTPDLFAWTVTVVALSVCFERLTLLCLRGLQRLLERV